MVNAHRQIFQFLASEEKKELGLPKQLDLSLLSFDAKEDFKHARVSLVKERNESK